MLAPMISPARKRWLLRISRQYWVFLRDFFRDLFDARLEHYAASLSWSTIFALVPLLAMAIALFASVSLFAPLKASLWQLMTDNLPLADAGAFMARIEAWTANAAHLGPLGLAYALLASFLFLRTFDYIVQDVCGAPQRGFFSALRAYGLLALAIPLLAGLAHGIDAAAAARLGAFSSLLRPGLSFLLIWGILWLVFQVAPNRAIAPRAAAASAFITALVWSLSRAAFVLYVTHNRTYASIYGSVAAILFALLWIHLSWAVFIHGLKFCALLNRGEEVRRI